MNKNILAIVVLVVLLVLVIWFLVGSSNSSELPQTNTIGQSTDIVNTRTPSSVGTADNTKSMTDTPGVQTITLVGENFKFSQSEIRVKQGDTVRLVFKSKDGFHDWRVDEYALATKVLQSGEEETLEFLADTAGTFEYYCSVGSHRQMGMKGQLVVER